MMIASYEDISGQMPAEETTQDCFDSSVSLTTTPHQELIDFLRPGDLILDEESLDSQLRQILGRVRALPRVSEAWIANKEDEMLLVFCTSPVEGATHLGSTIVFCSLSGFYSIPNHVNGRQIPESVRVTALYASSPMGYINLMGESSPLTLLATHDVRIGSAYYDMPDPIITLIFDELDSLDLAYLHELGHFQNREADKMLSSVDIYKMATAELQWMEGKINSLFELGQVDCSQLGFDSYVSYREARQIRASSEDGANERVYATMQTYLSPEDLEIARQISNHCLQSYDRTFTFDPTTLADAHSKMVAELEGDRLMKHYNMVARLRDLGFFVGNRLSKSKLGVFQISDNKAIRVLPDWNDTINPDSKLALLFSVYEEGDLTSTFRLTPQSLCVFERDAPASSMSYSLVGGPNAVVGMHPNVLTIQFTKVIADLEQAQKQRIKRNIEWIGSILTKYLSLMVSLDGERIKTSIAELCRSPSDLISLIGQQLWEWPSGPKSDFYSDLLIYLKDRLGLQDESFYNSDVFQNLSIEAQVWIVLRDSLAFSDVERQEVSNIIASIGAGDEINEIEQLFHIGSLWRLVKKVD